MIKEKKWLALIWLLLILRLLHLIRSDPPASSDPSIPLIPSLIYSFTPYLFPKLFSSLRLSPQNSPSSCQLTELIDLLTPPSFLQSLSDSANRARRVAHRKKEKEKRKKKWERADGFNLLVTCRNTCKYLQLFREGLKEPCFMLLFYLHSFAV